MDDIKLKGKAKWHPNGRLNPFYGKKHSPEALEKMRQAKLGKKRPSHSEDVKRRISASNTGQKRNYAGELHWNWKGGITKKNKTERTKFLKYTQKKIFARDAYTCVLCKIVGGNLQVDHIKSWAKHPELRFEESNCRTLCMPCHYYVTFKRKIPEGIVWGHNLSRRIAS